MKKILLSLIVPLVFITTLSAQISREQADQIVQQRLDNATKPYCAYVQEEVQTEFKITTTTGEVLELGHPCWIYYVSYIGETNGKYLIVKESNGNVLEVKAKNDDGPNDLTKWKPISFLIGTKWRLTGIVDVETNVLTELEPKDDWCYTLVFATDSTAGGRITLNYLLVKLRPKPIFFVLTSAGENGDGWLFIEITELIESYRLDLSKKELKFFYDNKKKYLLYKQT